MPSFVPRSMEPYQKNELLEKRICALRGVVASRAEGDKVVRAAEKVRSAILAVIKARRSILASSTAALTLPSEHPDAVEITRQLENLREEEKRWRSLEAKAIVEQCVK